MKFEISHRQFENIQAFSHFDKAFQSQDPRLVPFINRWPSLSAFGEVISEKSFDQGKRDLLVQTLLDQYRSVGLNDSTKENIGRLGRPDTYTVITAHQPVLFGGPLYIFYKIASAIRLARDLKSAYPNHDFVPVFIMGGEDHDFEEVNHTNLFRHRLEWNHFQGGSIGRYQLNEFHEVVDQLEELLGRAPHGNEIMQMVRSCFSADQLYGKAYQKFIHSLFGEHGLVVVDMDDRQFKKAFAPVMIREVTERRSQELIEQTQEELQALGFKKQAHARAVNLFYLGDDFRSVILYENGKFLFRETGDSYTEDDLIRMIREAPENFSPNVAMRPLYQEFTFPNLAYVGGGGELAYWTERKSQFQHFDISYPILIRRNSAAVIESHVLKRLDKLGLDWLQLFEEKSSIHYRLLEDEHANEDKLAYLGKSVLAAFGEMKRILEEQDNGLGVYASAEERKLEKTIENFQAKSFRQVKKVNEDRINQYDRTLELVFPANGLQERHFNGLPLYSRLGPSFLECLIEHLDPLDRRFLVLIEKD